MDASWPLSPRPDPVKACDSLSAEQQDHFDLLMAIYAAVVEHLDRSVGRLVDALKQKGALDNQPIEREALFWEHEGNAALRAGDWKLVRLGRKGTWELYNLKLDRTEQHDLSAQEPRRVRELSEKWEAWAERAHVKPYPGADGKKNKDE